MSTPRVALRALLAAAALAVLTATAACGGSTVTGAPAPAATPAAPAPVSASAAAPAPGASAPGDEAAVRGVFGRYNQALLSRDFETACAALVAGGGQKLAAGVAAQIQKPVGSCPDALAAVYSNQQAAAALDEATRNLMIQSVAVAGDNATVTYTSAVQGKATQPFSIVLQRQSGEWKVPVNGG